MWLARNSHSTLERAPQFIEERSSLGQIQFERVRILLEPLVFASSYEIFLKHRQKARNHCDLLSRTVVSAYSAEYHYLSGCVMFTVAECNVLLGLSSVFDPFV
ncbi:hypothetical protein KIN20_003381 [Parelaphostrongylus tenuis]|uniref:Uncharacterized protein n=1 Tax=Parelaphostrongylus tenuis TaxID=148309 RepID=A0AAD5QEB0_PARTN|nr:hypothetical protein KIN20_003381 [Parelaphostrongylus tenuis]